MKVTHDMVYFDKSSLQKLEAQLADVQNVYKAGVTHSTVQNALQRLQDKARDTKGGYRSIFQSAFKNLEDHVSDVQSSQGNKYRRGNSQRPHRPSSTRHTPGSELVIPLPTRSQSDPHCYPDDLHSSLQVFQIRKWRPLTASHKPLSSTCRSASERPRSSPATHRPVPPQKSCPELQKKHSQQESLWYPPWVPRPALTLKEETPPEEHLSPNIFSYFVNGHGPVMPTLTYGDISKQTATKGTLTEESTDWTKVLSEKMSSTSGIESDGGISDTAVETPSRDDLDTDSTSELYKRNDPLADFMLQLAILDLRPEKLEPTDTHEIKCFDFSVGKLENPLYEFKCPVPIPLDSVDVSIHAKENSDWRIAYSDCDSIDPVVGAMFDRLVEMGRLQIETQESEERRARLMRKRPVSRCNKLRDRRVCNVCLQPGCVGDCSGKRREATSCEKCHQPLCNGMCRNIKCDLRMRQCVDERRTTTNSPSTPQQCCKSGDRQMETGRPPSRNIFTRPKTATAVLSRVRSISESRLTRPVSASISGNLSKEADRLGLEPSPPKLRSNKRLTVPRKTDEQVTSKNNSRADVSTRRRSSTRIKQQSQRNTDLV